MDKLEHQEHHPSAQPQHHPPSSSQSSGLESKSGPPNFVGKHRMAAAIAKLHNEIQIIQEELEQLETRGQSSIVCQEIISAVDSAPDALLPLTRGPANVAWDRWFNQDHGSRIRNRWI
ncbi:G-protein gamma-like domain [Dillenia turbinata]|uniref:G-protein gamma-like domain n=1 Tax=Dillenia turbinata TaxID=194707 RepID=A0AAN8UKZ5_9MAGN